MNENAAIISRFNKIKQQINQIAASCSRSEQEITILAVSKNHTTEVVQTLIEAGHYHFGENRVQEAISKFSQLREKYPSLKLQLIGPLQVNKVKDAVAFFDVIATLDRERLAAAIADQVAKQSRRIECYVQINIGRELQKSGCLPENADSFIDQCLSSYHLNITGLMCVPPIWCDPTPYFQQLRQIAARHNLKHLSMGMSNDFPAAIACGATEIRLGTAIFGSR